MKPTSIFSEISEGAFLLRRQIVGLAKEDPEILFLYKAYQLLFNVHLEHSKILIGFNLAGAYYSWCGEIIGGFRAGQVLEDHLNIIRIVEPIEFLFLRVSTK